MSDLVLNLALNGRDAMPQGRTLTISTALVELGRDYAAPLPAV